MANLLEEAIKCDDGDRMAKFDFCGSPFGVQREAVLADEACRLFSLRAFDRLPLDEASSA
jgi:hypothetical protein